MWSEKLKLTKQLVRSVMDAGYLTAKEIQVKTLSRIVGGQDIIAVGPQGCGKTTAYILGVLARLKYGFEEAPRALILVPDKEAVLSVIEQFELINKNASIRIVGLYTAPGTEAQINALTDGVDIVVATPDRARAIYLKLGLNLNKIIMFIVDDADEIIKKGLQLPVAELANSIIKCQRLVFTQVVHSKLNQMTDPFMHQPVIIEVEELGGAKAEVHQQLLYYVPNYRTKLNLLTLLLNKVDAPEKVAVFVNTRLNAEKVYSHVKLSMKNGVAILNPMMFESKGFTLVTDFVEQEEARILIIADETAGLLDLGGISYLIHLEIPENTENFVNRVIKDTDSDMDVISISMANDLELVLVKKIEQAIGQKIAVDDLPVDLVIVNEQKENKPKQDKDPKNNQFVRGEAFHEKKAANSKDYNYSAGTKAKMNKKKNH